MYTSPWGCSKISSVLAYSKNPVGKVIASSLPHTMYHDSADLVTFWNACILHEVCQSRCLQFRRQSVQSQIQQILWVWNRKQCETYITAVESARQSSAVSCGMFHRTTHSHTFSEECIACATGDANMSCTFSHGHYPVDTNRIITGTDCLVGDVDKQQLRVSFTLDVWPSLKRETIIIIVV